MTDSKQSKRRWMDTHVHVSSMGAEGAKREHLLEDLLDVLDRCDADLRWVISPDNVEMVRIWKEVEGVYEGSRFIYDLVRRSEGRLYGSCMVNPHFLDESLRTMEACFEKWGFVQLGEMLQYVMDYQMDSLPVECLVRKAAEYGVPVHVHISTSWPREGIVSTYGMQHLRDLLALAERVPEARYILAHAISDVDDNPPVVDQYLDTIEARFGQWPDNFWIEIRDADSPGIRSAFARVPSTQIMMGTDWVSRVGPPFLPYGVIFLVPLEESRYEPSVSAMVELLRRAGASEDVIDQIGFKNAEALLLGRR